ncbi:membrane protein [sediment metagenome]|uniref:Membrane protein n=1 Tax=sediment metagenome TaxID=749907 RepID=D9PHZ8_9ZZZZ
MKGVNLERKVLIAGAVVYALLLFALLTLWRLPADRWLGYMAERMTRGNVALRAERVTPALPLGYRFHQVSYTVSQGSSSLSGRLDTLTVTVDFLRLFSAYLPGAFMAVFPSGGVIDGSAGISMFGGPEKGFLSMKTSGLPIDGLGLGDLLNRNVKGILTGEVTAEGPLADPIRLFGQGVLVLRKGSVETKLDLAGLKAVPFERMRLPFTLRDGVLLIENAEMEGPWFSGTVSGRIRLKSPLQAVPWS